jgi:hypothetical protein
MKVELLQVCQLINLEELKQLVLQIMPQDHKQWEPRIMLQAQL